MIVITRTTLSQSMTMMTTVSKQTPQIIKEVESKFYVLECNGRYIRATGSDWGPDYISDDRIDCARKFHTYNEALEFSKSPGQDWFDGGYRPVRVDMTCTFYRGV